MNKITIIKNSIVAIFENKELRRIIKTVEPIPGLFVHAGVSVAKQVKKSDYAPYLKWLTQNGMSIKQAASICNISYSYATKLLKTK